MKHTIILAALVGLAVALPARVKVKRQDPSTNPAAVGNALANFQSSVDALNFAATDLNTGLSTANLQGQMATDVGAQMVTLNSTLVQLASVTANLSQALGVDPTLDPSTEDPPDESASGEPEPTGVDPTDDGGVDEGSGEGEPASADEGAPPGPADTPPPVDEGGQEQVGPAEAPPAGGSAPEGDLTGAGEGGDAGGEGATDSGAAD